MEPSYIIYSTRGQGWVNRGGTCGTQLEEARRFKHDEAMAYCKRANNVDSFPTLIPVAEGDLISAGITN